MVKRVCVIGAGPSGMSALCWFANMKKQGREIPEIVCYEKQEKWGGLWNYSWRTGMDANGEPVHNGMYRHLWSNSPKECLEFPHYTFEQHFGKPVPSYPPRAAMLDYLVGRFNQEDTKHFIKFNHVVKDVVYNENEDNFSLTVRNLKEDQVAEGEKFDYVIVCSGHFSVPNVPHFAGLETFPGRVLHSHDFRDANEWAGKKVLAIGSHYSAEDVALQCLKFGAESIICTWRSKPMDFKWPSKVTQRPLIQRFEGKTAHFKDGSTAEVDVVVICTGYLHSYPFLRDSLRLKSANMLYPPNLYKGIVWQQGGNNKLLYIGNQDLYYSFTMFDVCALWAVKLILKDISLPSKDTMDKDWRNWVDRNKSLKDCYEDIVFQTDYVKDIVSDLESDYPYDLDVKEMFNEWEGHKVDNILTFRDQCFTCKFTGTPSPAPKKPFMSAMDDSLQNFV